jgi:hypothetical protein
MEETENTVRGREHVSTIDSDHPILEVVQNHRQLRPIAPTIESVPTFTLPIGLQLTWTAATQAVFAAWLPSSCLRNAVVAYASKSGTRVSQTARTSLGRKPRFLLNHRPFAGRSKTYRVALNELGRTGRHIISYRLARQEKSPAWDSSMD